MRHFPGLVPRLAFLLLLAIPTTPAQATDCPDLHSIVDYAPYRDLLCNGITKLAVGLPVEALKDFEAAVEIDIHEVPNFEVYSYLAQAQLLSGNVKAARESIRRSELALLVWSGVYRCDHTEAEVHLLDEVGLAIDSDEADAMAARMCGDIFTAYYEPGARTLESIAIDGQLAEKHLRVRALIERHEALTGSAQ